MAHISRCTVCIATGYVMAIHSQSTQVPNCPVASAYGSWTSLWTGYSFLMHAIGSVAVGQQLDSPGSCLQYYSGSPYVECDADGHCHYWSDYMMYWLYPTDAHFVNNTVKRGDVAGRIGRCRVCAYTPNFGVLNNPSGSSGNSNPSPAPSSNYYQPPSNPSPQPSYDYVQPSGSGSWW